MSFYHKVSEKIKDLKFLKQERGAILVLTALLLPIIFGCLGIGYDIGNLYMHKARLQNVADAAALAGGRAYLDSQTKTTGVKDTIDDNTNGNADQEYVIGGSKTRGGKHPDADRAADEYIYRNIINLGEKVYSDKYSHYALKGLKKSGENYAVADEIFYRIGLYETVPLRFLPLLTNKYNETVRAGAVALIQPGTPGSNSGGGSTATITHTSIFDNLFTFSESLFTRNNIDSDGSIHQSFQGDMVYTHRNSLVDGTPTGIYFESSTPGPAGDDDATNTNQNHWYEQMGGKGSSGTTLINDPIIDTTFDTKAYLDAFKKKLNGPHVDVRSQNDFTGSNAFTITQASATSNATCRAKYTVSGATGQGVYYKVDDDYYLLTSNDEYTTFQSNGKTYKVCYHKIPNTNYLIRCGKTDGDDTYYILTADNRLTNCYIKIIQPQPSNPYWKYEAACIGNDTTNFYYNNGAFVDSNWQPTISNDRFIPAKPDDPIDVNNFQQQTVSGGGTPTNIYHILLKRLNNENDTIKNLEIAINEPIPGNENEPVYILVEGINQVKIIGNAVTTNRPVIIVFLSADTTQIKYEFTGGEFKGVIYAPISGFEHVQNLTGKFRGNIITKDIYIQASSRMEWKQENFLENAYYTDADIKAVSDANKQRIEVANAALTPEIRQKLLDRLGVTAEQMDSKDWFEKLRYPEKQNLYNNWKALYEEYKNDPVIRNILWPWNEHFNIGPGEEQIETTNDTLRLINYRTEYQTKADGSIEDGKVLDPFIFETLGKPNSY